MEKPNKAKAIELLRMALSKIPALREAEHDLPKLDKEIKKWKRNTEMNISDIFGNGSLYLEEFRKIPFTPPHYIELYKSLKVASSLLESMIDGIEEYWEDEHQKSTSSFAQQERTMNTNEIFIIHGRDNEIKATVARFLGQLDLKPIILHEQPNQGRTVIEKFEQYAQVRFAVALLTPDDVGALQEKTPNLKPRARQNVIFEFGYFIGRLGRNRVCALTKGDVEIPSDYDGVVYIPLDDAGGWKLNLVKELKNAGIAVDANRAL